MISELLTIRPERVTDFPEITQVSDQAFGRNDEAVLIEKIRESSYYIAELSLVAEINHKIVGYIMFSYIHLRGEEEFLVLGLAPLAVIPSHQNQGIGSQLVQRGLELAESRGESLVMVLGEPHFYQRFGFLSAIDYGIESPWVISHEYWMIKPLRNYQKKHRGKIIYPSYFDEV